MLKCALAFALTALLLSSIPAAASSGAPRGGTRAGLSPLPPLRSERTPLEAGAEIVTVFGAADGSPDVPLVAVLNDTLGDDDPANDRLRYVWVFSYCPPSIWQRLVAAIPFYYHRVSPGSGKVDPAKPPPAIFDLSRGPESAWRRVMWHVFQNAVVDPHGWAFQAGARTYARNEREYRRGQLERGLSTLNLYRYINDDVPELDDPRFERLYGRVVEGGYTGLLLNERHLAEVHARDSASSRKRIGINWELLRQRCEEEGLVFEPLPASPARARHAIVWVSAEAVASSPRDRAFNGRFLNIKSPWSDGELRSWEGYSKVFFAAPDGRISRAGTPGARPVAMIPLAVYGLDFPKIPALLVDFRSVLNPKRRELSRRAIDDVGRFLLDASPFGEWKYYAAKKLYAIVTGRKGIDLYQPSRAQCYAQLRSLLVLKDVLDPELQAMVERDLERLNVNPFGTDLEKEREIAFTQYAALIDYAKSGGLSRKLEGDRLAEMTRLAHGRVRASFLRVAHVASLGLYKHRDDSPELREMYAASRALDVHGSLLSEVALAPAPVEVTWAPEKFHPALEYVRAHGELANGALARTCETIFHKSSYPDTKHLALDALHRIGDKAAREALERIAADPAVAEDLRDRSAQWLGRASEPHRNAE